MRRAIAALAATVLLAGCSGDKPAAVAEMQSSATRMDTADETAYLDGLRAREPERMAEYDEAEMVDLGLVACDLTDGYVSGDEPNPGDELLAEMVERGHDEDVAESMTSDIRNAMEGTLCYVDRSPTG